MDGSKETFLLIIAVAVLAFCVSYGAWLYWEARKERKRNKGVIPGRELYRRIREEES